MSRKKQGETKCPARRVGSGQGQIVWGEKREGGRVVSISFSSQSGRGLHVDSFVGVENGSRKKRK